MNNTKTNWQTKKLGEVCDFFTDGNWIESKDQSSDGIRLIQTGNIGQGFFKDRGEKARYISEKTFKRLKCTEIFKGDVLISRLPDPVGRACILPETGEKMITAVDCSILRLNKNISPKFLNYYTQSNSYLSEVEQKTTGTTRKRISRKNLGLVKIPLPPLPEQRRIVKVLDEVFADVAKAKENAEKNLQNAKELFESYLQSVFANPGKGWQTKKLGEVCDFYNGLWKGKKPPYIEVGVIRNTNFTKDGELDDSDIAYLEVEKKQFENRKLTYGDIILEKSGGGPKQPVGRVVIFNKKEGDFSFSNFTSAIRVKKSSELDFNFLHRFLFFSYISGITEKMQSHSTGIRNLDSKLYKNIEIPLPPLPEQRRIVKKLDALSAETKKLETIYKQKLADLEELKKSVLKKAFEGELYHC